MKIFFFLLGLFLLGCSSYNNTNSKFEIENCSISADTLIRKDGFYSESIENGHTSVKELFFIDENVVKMNGSSYDNEFDRYSFYKNYKLKFNKEILKSKYCIINNKLYVSTYQSVIKDCFVHSCSDIVLLNFAAEIKNKDTLVNWHIVPPYPKLNEKEMKLNEDLFKPKTLIFIKSDAVKKLNNPTN